METEALTQGQADEIAVAQLYVFELLAKQTATGLDDWAVKLAQDNPEARAFIFAYLGLESEAQQLLDLSSLSFLGDLAKYGVTIKQLVDFLNQIKQYAPQILAAVQVIKALFDAFKGAVPTPTPSVPGVQPIVPPKF